MSISITTLEQIADIALGYKSLQNQFYYLNQETVDTYGIESEFLLPITMMKDLDNSSFYQSYNKKQFLFYCKSDEHDIKGTGAYKYIRTMSDHSATEKKQSGKLKTIKEVLSEQGGKNWYAPKATPHKSHIWLRKAIDGIYSPYLFKNTALVDQRCNRIIPKTAMSWQVLASLFTSTVFSLSLEVNGNSSMGAGALEVPTKSLQTLPIIDIRMLTKKQSEKLVELATDIWLNESPVDWKRQTEPTDKTIKLDEWILSLLNNPISLDMLYSDLSVTAGSRFVLAQDKKTKTKLKTKTDISSIAKGIASSVQKLLDGKRFPEHFCLESDGMMHLAFDGHKRLTINLDVFFTDCLLEISDVSGRKIYSKQLPKHIAELIVHAMLLGRRDFSVPKDVETANKVLQEFFKWFDNINNKIVLGIQESALGTSLEDTVRDAVYSELKFNRLVGAKHLPHSIDIV